MRGWKQGGMFLAGQESQDCFDFISNVGICGIYLFVSGSWYCQIQTTRLIMFFDNIIFVAFSIHFRPFKNVEKWFSTTKVLVIRPLKQNTFLCVSSLRAYCKPCYIEVACVKCYGCGRYIL